MSPRPPVAIFQEEAIREVISIDRETIDVIEQAFCLSAKVEVSMPPMMQILTHGHGGQTCVKGAWMPGLEYFAVKLSSIYPRPPGMQAAEANGMFVLVESATGRIKACLLDNGYLTQLRTAAAGAVAAQHLAPTFVETVGTIGAGKQALWQLVAAHLVRPFKHVAIWSRRVEQAAALAKRVESLLPVSATAVMTIREAIAPAQLVLTTTSSCQSLLTEHDLHPTLHITAMGSDAKGKRELSDALLREVDLYVADDLGQCRAYGELQTLPEREIACVATLSGIIAGRNEGRRDSSHVTVADLTGLGIQDTAIAIAAYRRLVPESRSE